MKKKPDIIEIFQREGFEPIQKGRYFWLSCPFHEDKTPSLKIDPDRQAFHCFGCGASGDVIAFVQRLHGLTFKDALKYLNLQGNHAVRIAPQKQTKRDLLKAFNEWQRTYYHHLCDTRLTYESLTEGLKTWQEIERVAWIYHEMPLIEYRLDILFHGTDEEKYELYQEVKENGNEGI